MRNEEGKVEFAIDSSDLDENAVYEQVDDKDLAKYEEEFESEKEGKVRTEE